MFSYLKNYENHANFVKDFNIPLLDVLWVFELKKLLMIQRLGLNYWEEKSYALPDVDIFTKFTLCCFSKKIQYTSFNSVI